VQAEKKYAMFGMSIVAKANLNHRRRKTTTIATTLMLCANAVSYGHQLVNELRDKA